MRLKQTYRNSSAHRNRNRQLGNVFSYLYVNCSIQLRLMFSSPKGLMESNAKSEFNKETTADDKCTNSLTLSTNSLTFQHIHTLYVLE